MKKLFTAIIIIAALTMFAACGSSGSDATGEDLANSRYIGTWKVATLAIGDVSDGFEGDDFSITLNEDGTGQFVSEEGASEITWSLTKDGFQTVDTDGSKMSFKDDGDNIKTKIIGVDLIFEKQ